MLPATEPHARKNAPRIAYFLCEKPQKGEAGAVPALRHMTVTIRESILSVMIFGYIYYLFFEKLQVKNHADPRVAGSVAVSTGLFIFTASRLPFALAQMLSNADDISSVPCLGPFASGIVLMMCAACQIVLVAFIASAVGKEDLNTVIMRIWDRSGTFVLLLLLVIVPTVIVSSFVSFGAAVSSIGQVFEKKTATAEFCFRILERLFVYETLGCMYLSMRSAVPVKKNDEGQM